MSDSVETSSQPAAALGRLKPCPFCGAGEMQIRENGRIWAGMRYSEPVSVSIFHWCPPIPGQPARPIERAGRDLDSAIEIWNTRRPSGERRD